eukprot:2622943-Rhodomonas_salina.1
MQLLPSLPGYPAWSSWLACVGLGVGLRRSGYLGTWYPGTLYQAVPLGLLCFFFGYGLKPEQNDR